MNLVLVYTDSDSCVSLHCTMGSNVLVNTFFAGILLIFLLFLLLLFGAYEIGRELMSHVVIIYALLVCVHKDIHNHKIYYFN